MLKNFMKRFTKAEIPKQVSRWLFPEAEAEHWTMPDPAVYANQADLYRKLSYIGTVADITAGACTDADFDIMGVNDKEVENHPLDNLLLKPNGYDSRTEFFRAHYMWRIITGNSYWFLNRASDKVAPDEIWILPPSKIIPVPDGKLGLRGYLYTPGNGAEIPLEPWEVIHFKSFNPRSRYLGLSAIESLAATSYGALAAQEWNTRLFAENNARLPGILAFAEMIQDPDWDKLKREVANSAAKRNNMMLRGVGKGGVEWMQGSATQREMEFLAGLDRSMREIYDRIAPGLYNMLTANSSLANGETGAMAFMKLTVSPLLRETTDKINAELLPVYGGNVTAKYEDVVPEDKAQKIADIRAYSETHTIDQVNAKFWGDKSDNLELGKLFVVQVTAQSGKPINDAPLVDSTQPVEVPTEEVVPVVEPVEPESPAKADLRRWKRKAIKNFGKPLAHEFTSEYIPTALHDEIVDGIKSAKTPDEVAQLFHAIERIDKMQDVSADSIKALADSINRMVETIPHE